MTCLSGSPLFSFDHNSTADIIDRLRKFREAYEPWHGYLCVIICTFGLVTNVINIIILTKRQMRTSVNMLLTGIACCDIGTMASYLIYIIHFVFADPHCNPRLYTYSWMLFLVCHIIFSVALHTTGLWLAVVMAFIRNMTLKRALNGSKWLSSNNTWKICIGVYACVFLLCIPSVFGSDIVRYPSYFNDTCRMGEVAAKYDRMYTVYTIGIPENNCLIYTITLWLTGTVFKIIPCVLLAFLITSLLWTIKKAEKRRRALFESNSTNRARIRLRQQQRELHGAQAFPQSPAARSDRTTTMLLVILGLFLVTELPQGAISILTGIYMGDVREFVYPNLGDILDLLSLINSAVNFILYCAMSSKYRQVFWQVVLPRSAYVRWFVKPRMTANGCPNQDPTATGRSGPGGGATTTQLGGNRSIRRPELQMLATMANRVEEMDEEDDREERDSTLDLYKPPMVDEDDDEEDECSTTMINTSDGAAVVARNIPRAISASSSVNRLSTMGSFRIKKLSDSNLRRHVLTRAAILAATPAMASGAMTVSSQSLNDSRACSPPMGIVKSASACPTTSPLICAADNNDNTTTTITADGKRKKHRWLISCSCLCKCACRSGSGSEASGLDRITPNLIKRKFTMMTPSATCPAVEEGSVGAAKKLIASSTPTPPILDSSADGHPTSHVVCSSIPIWRRCSNNSGPKTEYVFV